MNAEEAAEWLRELDASIWRTEYVQMTANMSGHTWKERVRVVVRTLTPEELATIREVAREFVVVPVNAGMGFNFGVIFYKAPSYPGVPLEFLCALEGELLPRELGQRFEDAWREFSPLSHNEENARLLAHFGRERPRDEAHYAP